MHSYTKLPAVAQPVTYLQQLSLNQLQLCNHVMTPDCCIADLTEAWFPSSGMLDNYVLSAFLCTTYACRSKYAAELASEKTAASRYGEEFSKVTKQVVKARKPIRLLYFEGNHYNLLL